MRPLLAGFVLLGLPILWLVAIWWFLRSPRQGVLGTLTVSDLLQIVTAVVALAAILIAIASYQHATGVGERALAASGEQSRLLEEQRQALEESREALDRLLDSTGRDRQPPAPSPSEPAREETAALPPQPARPAAPAPQAPRVPGTRRPRLEFSLGDTDWATLRTGAPARLPLRGRKLLLDLGVRNVGDVPLRRPSVSLRALPSTVVVDPSRFSATAAGDIPPASAGGRSYTYTFTGTLPDDVQTFVLLVAIWGDNLARQTLRIPIEVSRR